MERMIGLIARELGLEPAEVRRRNLIQPDEFPWDVGLTFQDGSPTRYDSGNYPAGLEMALERDRLRRLSRAPGGGARRGALPRPRASRATSRGRASARTRAPTCASSRAGKVLVATGLTTQGQGHQTTFAQIAAAALGMLDLADVTVVTGDTARFNWGAGTYASRALVTSGNAVPSPRARSSRQGAPARGRSARASPGRSRARRTARVRVQGVPGRALTLGALADGRPTRSATRTGKEAAEAALRLVKPRQGAVLRARTRQPGLEAHGYYAPPQATFASGCHAAIVEVDRRDRRGHASQQLRRPARLRHRS